MIGIFAWIVFGFIVGLVARAVMPGDQPMGFIKTTALGVGGSFVGGFIGHALFHPSFGHWSHAGRADTAGFIGSVLGALAIMFIAGVVRRR